MEKLRPRGVVEYLEPLWRKKLLILLMTASMGIASFLVIRRLPNIYESQASLAISSQANEEQVVQGTPLAALMQQMTSRANLIVLIRRYNLYYQPNRPADIDDLVERLRKEIKSEIKLASSFPNAPESLSLSYRYPDPVIAQRLVADLVSTFEQSNSRLREQATTEIERFRTKIVEVETRLQELAPQRELELSRMSGGARTEIDPLGSHTQRQAITGSMDSLSAKEFSLERQIDEQKQLITQQQKLLAAVAGTQVPKMSGAYGSLLTRKADIEAQIKFLATTVTEKNPKMIQARLQLAEVSREIAQLETNQGAKTGAVDVAVSPEARELRAMERALKGLETELETTRYALGRQTQALDTLPKTDAAPVLPAPTEGASPTKAEYDRLLSRYNWLMDKQETLQKLSGGTASNNALFRVVDAPHAAQLPVAPNRQLLRLLGLVIGFCLGLFAVIARELPRWVLINNEKDVEFYLGAPVLALIPETLTPFERSRRRRLGGFRWLGLTLLATGMIPVFVAVLNLTRIFQILASR